MEKTGNGFPVTPRVVLNVAGRALIGQTQPGAVSVEMRSQTSGFFLLQRANEKVARGETKEAGSQVLCPLPNVATPPCTTRIDYREETHVVCWLTTKLHLAVVSPSKDAFPGLQLKCQSPDLVSQFF